MTIRVNPIDNYGRIGDNHGHIYKRRAMMKHAIDPLKAYRSHKSSAERRGIPFLLTLGEWMSVWAPHWERRETENLSMCRTGDKGAYELGNVRIDTQKENFRERSAIVKQLSMAASASCVTPLPRMIDSYEKDVVIQAIDSEGGHLTNASKRLGITFRQLRYLVSKHSIGKRQ